MAQVVLISKDQLPTEPDYNGSDDNVDSSSEPHSSCSKCSGGGGDSEPKPELKHVYLTNTDKRILYSLTKEAEVILVVESENMSGLDVKIDLAEVGCFRYNDEDITADKVLKLTVSADVEEIPLVSLASKGRPPREEEFSDIAKLNRCYFLQGGEEVDEIGGGAEVSFIVESQGMIGEEVTIDFSEESQKFESLTDGKTITDDKLTFVIQSDVEQIELRALHVESEGDPKPEFLEAYFVDQSERPLKEAIIGQIVTLVIRTRNMIGETLTINFNNSQQDYKNLATDTVLVDDTLEIEVASDNQYVELEILPQAATT